MDHLKPEVFRFSCLVVFNIIALSPSSWSSTINDEWTVFKHTYGKQYYNETEDHYRLRLYLENKARIEQHNEKFILGSVTFEMKANQFSDMSVEEIRRLKNKHEILDRRKRSVDLKFTNYEAEDLPSSIDWRKSGAVTGVKTQGACGACWAFSATGALEGQMFLKHGILLSLSEQNLIDCTREYLNKGCDGGLLDRAFQYVTDNGGVDTEESYPYQMKDGNCRFNKSSATAKITGFVRLPPGDEEALKTAVATVGPIAAAVDTDPMTLYLYSGGVYFEKECRSTKVDHGVLIVGYGTSDDGQDYWLVKNSWGPDWGESGYFKIARGKDNHCGIASKSVFPILS